MAASTESGSTSRSKQPGVRRIDTPASALLAARLGGAVALAAAASLSFNALCDLARHAGLHHLAALLPIAVDAFAASALFVSYRLPGGHAAHRAASRTARLALALTVACNGLDHLLDLAGYLLTERVRDLLLVAVASLPPLIVERLLRLQTALIDDRSEAAAFIVDEPWPVGRGDGCDGAGPSGLSELTCPGELTSDAGATDPADHHEMTGLADHGVVQQPTEVEVDGHSSHEADGRPPRRPREEHWLSVAVPVYRRLVVRTGRRPTESAFHAALTDALAGDAEEAGSEASAPMSLSTAKRIRALVEDRGLAD